MIKEEYFTDNADEHVELRSYNHFSLRPNEGYGIFFTAEVT